MERRMGTGGGRRTLGRAGTTVPAARWIVLAAAVCGAPRPATAAQEGDTARVVALEPLEVTVLRGPVALGSAPYAVAALGEASLRSGKTGLFLEEAVEAVPGLSVQNRFNFAVGERVSVRGFGPRAQFGIRGLRILVDGVPATMPDGQSTLDHLDFATLGRMELLRGPASALYGNGAGGVLAFESRSPRDAPWIQEVRAVAGSHGLLNLQATAEGRSGGPGWIVGGGRLTYDGFRADPSTEGDTYGSAERLNVNGAVHVPLAGGELRIGLAAVDLDAENPGSLSAEALADGTPAFGFNVAQRTGKEVTQAQLGGRWVGPLSGVEAEAAAWGVVRDVRNPIPPSIVDLGRGAGGARILVRDEASLPIPLSWGAGVELELQHDDRQNYDNDGGEAGALTLDQREEVRGVGTFLQARAGVAARLDVVAALRYDRFRFEAADRFVGTGEPDDSGVRTMDAVSPSAGAVVRLGGRTEAYANVAASFETPTTTELANRPDGAGGFNPDLEPRTALTWEGGVRGRAGPRVSWEVSAFRTDVDDELVPFEVPEAPGRTFFRNAGTSVHEGWEVALRAVPVDGLTARVAWSHTDARFETFTVDGEDLSGNRIPGLAPDRVEGAVRLERGRAFAGLDARWIDEVPADDGNAASADAYGLVDLRAGLEGWPAGPVRVSPFAGVSNLFDRSYVAAVSVNAFGGRFFEPGPGRTLHVGLAVELDPR